MLDKLNKGQRVSFEIVTDDRRASRALIVCG
jgi:hypothetical protein